MNTEDNLWIYEGIKNNALYRKFDGNGKSIFENGTFYDQEYMVFTTYFSFEVRIGRHEEWNDVLYYSCVNNDGSLSFPELAPI